MEEVVKMKMLTEIIVILAGLFLIVDSIFIHAVTFEYEKWYIGFLDPYFSHALLGIGLLIAAVWDIKSSKRR